jgi:hypothetical protein
VSDPGSRPPVTRTSVTGDPRPRAVDDGQCPRWLAVVFWPWIDLGLVSPSRARAFLVVTAVIAAVIVVIGVLLWREMSRDFEATQREITSAMRAADRGPTR